MKSCHCCSGPCKKTGHFKNRNGVAQRYFCARCGKYFCESPSLDGVRLEHEKVVQIVKLLAEGLGVRSTARVTDCDPQTVLNVLETIGAKCASFHDRIARNIKTDALQIDELWARVFCSQKRAYSVETDIGDQYTFLALAMREKFIVSHHTGSGLLGCPLDTPRPSKTTALPLPCSFAPTTSARFTRLWAAPRLLLSGWQPKHGQSNGS